MKKPSTLNRITHRTWRLLLVALLILTEIVQIFKCDDQQIQISSSSSHTQNFYKTTTSTKNHPPNIIQDAHRLRRDLSQFEVFLRTRQLTGATARKRPHVIVSRAIQSKYKQTAASDSKIREDEEESSSAQVNQISHHHHHHHNSLQSNNNDTINSDKVGPSSSRYNQDNDDDNVVHEDVDTLITSSKYNSKNKQPQAREEDESNTNKIMMTTTKNITAQNGQSVLLHCIVEPSNDRIVSWVRLRDTQLLTVADNTVIQDERFVVRHGLLKENDWALQIQNVDKNIDSGIYECQTNSDPPESQYYQLNIMEPRAEIIGAPDMFVRLGGAINLTCVISPTPDELQFIFWYHDNRMINYDLNNQNKGKLTVYKQQDKVDTQVSNLIIYKAQLTDSGNYTCLPSSSRSISIYVHVLEGEKRSSTFQNDYSQGLSLDLASQTNSSPSIHEKILKDRVYATFVAVLIFLAWTKLLVQPHAAISLLIVGSIGIYISKVTEDDQSTEDDTNNKLDDDQDKKKQIDHQQQQHQKKTILKKSGTKETILHSNNISSGSSEEEATEFLLANNGKSSVSDTNSATLSSKDANSDTINCLLFGPDHHHQIILNDSVDINKLTECRIVSRPSSISMGYNSDSYVIEELLAPMVNLRRYSNTSSRHKPAAASVSQQIKSECVALHTLVRNNNDTTLTSTPISSDCECPRPIITSRSEEEEEEEVEVEAKIKYDSLIMIEPNSTNLVESCKHQHHHHCHFLSRANSRSSSTKTSKELATTINGDKLTVDTVNCDDAEQKSTSSDADDDHGFLSNGFNSIKTKGSSGDDKIRSSRLKAATYQQRDSAVRVSLKLLPKNTAELTNLLNRHHHQHHHHHHHQSASIKSRANKFIDQDMEEDGDVDDERPASCWSSTVSTGSVQPLCNSNHNNSLPLSHKTKLLTNTTTTTTINHSSAASSASSSSSNNYHPLYYHHHKDQHLDQNRAHTNAGQCSSTTLSTPPPLLQPPSTITQRDSGK